MASRKTDDLIDAIGQIDERYVEEARTATPFTFAGFRRKKSRILPVLLAAALSLALIFSVGVVALISDKSDKSVSSASPGFYGSLPKETQAPQPPPAESAPDRLTAQLLRYTPDRLAEHRIEKPDGAFADGVCRLVWTADGQNYYAVSITDSDDLARLNAYLSDPSSFESGSGDPGDLRFWICTGDGHSASPYLLYGAWGYGNLFDYSPETVPSSDFAAFLVQLIRENLE